MRLKVFVSLIFVTLLLIGVVNATNCSDKQVIMKLYSPSNSHGALWNDANYDIDVCYSEIFGVSGNGVHTCSGTNKVLGLFSSTNAHAEIPSLDNYETDVCYGDLTCVQKASQQKCDDWGGKIVVSLYQETNSHISKGDDVNYPIKICCKPGIYPIKKPGIVGKAYWADMKSESITTAQKDDTVKMIWQGTGLSEGTEVTFEIYEDDILVDDKIRTISEGNAITETVNADGDAIALWTITQADLDKTPADFGKFIFIVQKRQSGNLAISQTASNSPPHAVITSPAVDSKFKKGTAIEFVQASYDIDDDLMVTWDFGDGTTETKYNCQTNPGGCDATHTYTTSGTKVISLKAKEMTRTQYDTDYTRVFSYDRGLNLFPVITEPPFGKVSNNRMIPFDASDSYVSECETGSCPDTNCYSVGDLQCYDYSKSGIPEEYELWFDWTFSEGAGRNGTWTNDYDDVVVFNRVFYQPIKHWANLKLGYEEK